MSRHSSRLRVGEVEQRDGDDGMCRKEDWGWSKTCTIEGNQYLPANGYYILCIADRSMIVPKREIIPAETNRRRARYLHAIVFSVILI